MVISGGGTGGHLSPALALGAQLQRMRPECELLFIGTQTPLDEQFLARGGFPYRLLPGAGIAGRSLGQRLRALGKLSRATLAARRLLKRFKPALVVGVGGYASMPAGLAARSLGIPLVLMEQNTRPGLTNRLLARFAARICVAFPESLAMLPRGRVEVTGNP
ncbi:MAG TPA: UDP-N-acetylglucosamine--N-acetylmuramyl-(pentapeptide) pyrophosphoryl-undecaprenol N-acetylglucosamine transferase, partial [Candidatus Binataceae bacterium]|nr:UDP-N-acetylglucosamine--N-acetylmuramyl-(pentapeptide) pyrophosphoryl-undecaprenol N-acetylglucosamine transferase [Candidatus Binataceae bacterium]